MNWKHFAAGLCLAALSGCAAVGPDYKPPTLPQVNLSDMATAGKAQPHRATLTREDLVSWWKVFNDPVLTGLVKQALAANPDLRQARAKVREARAQLTVSRASQFPALDSSGSYTRSRGISSATSDGDALRTVASRYSAGFDASWEIDIFGGVRRAVAAARADIAAQEASLQSVWVSLAGEVAKTYAAIRSYQKRLQVARDNLKAQAETLAILQSRHRAGLSDELGVEQARYNLESSRSAIPTLKSGLESSLNALAVLVGRLPGDLQKSLAKTAPIPQAPFEAVVKIPADTLRQRPDVRMAERALAAQVERVGVATAQLYPRFSLSGSIGVESLKSSNLLLADSNFWSFLPSISWPIFHAGSIRANIEVQNAKQEQLAAQYEKTVLNAVKEIRDSLASFCQERERLAALSAAVQAAQKAAAIAQRKYRSGLASFSDVLDAQRSLFSYDDKRIASQEAITANLVSLYKALGGGWQHAMGGAPRGKTPEQKTAPTLAQTR